MQAAASASVMIKCVKLTVNKTEWTELMSHSIYLNLHIWMNMNELFSFIKNLNMLIQCTGGWFEIRYHHTR